MSTFTELLCLERGSATWPDELSRIDGPPERLWLRGELGILARRPRVAVVGTRGPSPYGEAQAARFAREIARAGAVVVSGLARGIDQAAHQAALDAGGATIGVLGSAVDRPWPDGPVARRVAERGLLLSEYQPGTDPRPHHFPLRNRLISGLCAGVLVVEAAAASGSLITARWAADQGRLVWAIPGRVDHPLSRGTHKLLREGAQLVETPEEVLREVLGGVGPERQPSDAAQGEVAPTEPGASILRALVGETLDASEIAARVGYDPAEVLAALVELELADRVARGPGGLYRRRTT
ncbi:MAG: DNA-protecting protein DprA [Planctomycetes bacterium]|nr:DNA-protecting protein DprA [Planctomycetota bacterium]